MRKIKVQGRLKRKKEKKKKGKRIWEWKSSETASSFEVLVHEINFLLVLSALVLTCFLAWNPLGQSLNYEIHSPWWPAKACSSSTQADWHSHM